MIIREMSIEEDMKQVGTLYQQIWDSNEKEFIERLKLHGQYPGFYGVVAVHDSDIVGFAYGYTSLGGQYYHELLKQAIATKHELWLTDCLEFVELAVDPLFRRKNIGRALVTSIIRQTEKKTAILTTQMNNMPARRLYESLGWEIIQDNFLPGKSPDPYVIMGFQRGKMHKSPQ